MSEIVDMIVVRVIAEVDDAQRKIAGYGGSVEQAFDRVEGAAARSSDNVMRAADKQRAAYRDLASQLSSAAIDIADGANAFTVLGRNGAAVAATIEGFGGTVGRVAGFMAGPWGIAITTAASIIGRLATRTGEAETKTRRKGEAARNLTEALDDLDAAVGDNNQSQVESIRLSLATARAFRDEEIKTRNKTNARLQDAIAEQRILAIRSQAPGQRGDVAAVGLLQANQKVAALESRLAENIKSIAKADADFRKAEAASIILNVEARLDPALAALQRFDQRVARLRAEFQAKKRDQASFDREVEKAARARDATLAAAARAKSGPAANSVAIDQSSRTILGPRAAANDRAPAAPRLGDANVPDDFPATIDVAGIKVPTEDDIAAIREEMARLYGVTVDLSKVELYDPEQMKQIAEVAGTLTKDLSSGLADAIVNGKSLGDALVGAFARAGQALIQSKILQMLDPAGDGSGGFINDATNVFGAIFGARTPARRASGGHVSAGQLYRVNEAGIEGFRPAGSGTIVPLGRMAAARPGGGVTVVQPLNVSFAGAITTPELMAEFKAYADGVGQAAAIGGAAMAQSRMARRAARALPR